MEGIINRILYSVLVGVFPAVGDNLYSPRRKMLCVLNSMSLKRRDSRLDTRLFCVIPLAYCHAVYCSYCHPRSRASYYATRNNRTQVFFADVDYLH